MNTKTRNKVAMTVLFIQTPVFFWASWVLIEQGKLLESAILSLMATGCIMGVERLIENDTKNKTKELIQGYQRIGYSSKRKHQRRSNATPRRKHETN